MSSILWSDLVPNALQLLSPTAWIVMLTVAASTVIFYRQRAEVAKHINRIPGPPALPLLGNSLQWLVDRDGKQISVSCNCDRCHCQNAQKN